MQNLAAELLLFNAIRQGDEKALEVVFLRYYRSLCRYAATLLKNEAEGQEIAADVFLVLWEKKETIEIKESLRQYLFAMARHRSLRRLRTASRVPFQEELTPETVSRYESNLDFDEESNKDNSRSSVDYLTPFIRQLPPQQQHIFHLNKIEGLTYLEIARRLGLSEKTVKNHIYRAMLRLKQLSVILLLLYNRSY